MKKFKTIFMLAACGCIFSMGTVSCGDDDEPDENAALADSLISRSLTITSGTRTVINESADGNDMTDVWAKGDKVLVLNMTQKDQTLARRTATLASDAEGTNVKFSGASLYCKNGDSLAIFYPAPNNGSVVLNANATLTLNLLNQTGTKVDMAANYDYTFARAKVNSCTWISATAATTSVSNVMTMMRISFMKSDGTTPITTKGIKQLKINVLSGDFYYKGTLNPETQKMTLSAADEASSITLAKANTSGNGTTAGDKSRPCDFYMMVFPGTYRLGFTASTTEGETYKYEMSNAATFKSNTFASKTVSCSKQ